MQHKTCVKEKGTGVGSAQTSVCLPVSDWEQLGFFSLGLLFSSYATMELVVAPFLLGAVTSPVQSWSAGHVHPSLFHRKPSSTL